MGVTTWYEIVKRGNKQNAVQQDIKDTLTSLINSFSGSGPGLVPTSPGGVNFYLRSDGTWAGNVSTAAPGLAPIIPGTAGTTLFLRSDATWASALTTPASGATFQITVNANTTHITLNDNANAPAAAAWPGGLAFIGGEASPTRGRLNIGDKSGWLFRISNRTSAGVVSDLTIFGDGASNTHLVQINTPSGYAGANCLNIVNPATGIFVINAAQGSSGSGAAKFPGTVVCGTSGGDYGFVGYNVRVTTTAGSYQYDATDLTSRLYFNLGTLSFQTAPSGTAGNAITWTTRMLIGNTGNFGIFSVAVANGGAAQSTGWGTPTGNVKVSAFPGATATLVQCSEVIAQIITDLKAWGFYGT